MANGDLKLLNKIKKYGKEQIPKYLEELDVQDIEHPLDEEILKILDQFEIRSDDNDYRIFCYLETIKKAWKLIIDKSIKCLRFFDTREPFLKIRTKHPIAYGVSELGDYFEKYSNFESMLYGGGKYYRDHVVHVFRVWMLGLECLLNKDGQYLERINIEKGIKINSLEKLSIWSMIALTHDLGYPLEKSQEIIDKTKDMMKTFIANPIVSMDLSFNGVQNNMNDFVLRFISSKMHEVNTNCPKENKEECKEKKTEEGKAKDKKGYVARLQPKYYFKFQKSLEQCKHGILSSIIIYKLLIYFLESDYNINEDYRFNEEDVRQFYIRREILRAIASHTCHDIYHLDILSFAYLLIIVDDCQEWGRKRISELYIKSNSTYELLGITPKFDVSESTIDGETICIHECLVSEQFKFEGNDIDGLKRILKSIQKQIYSYKAIFRDGQDTAKRNFIFKKHCNITYDDGGATSIFEIKFKISNEDDSTFTVKLKSADITSTIKEFGEKFLKGIYSCEVLALEQSSNLDTERVYSIKDGND
ncbi:hypothetical protein HBE96_05130 [Clostridium sp. P21]|uniref:Uncharacterized protein n=1 Tax=Clostridium muellerianum TaxID=2716538 RepID=A0A7Y0EEL1_9CLOT|nr:hypothetical protein [Clostridium muellerianum]NMM62081.1 hypothetical protein [Clostridium muellerianum]